jgi:ribosomal protein S18 acetylase RimI-like enzyme
VTNLNQLPSDAERMHIRTASKSDAEAITEVQIEATCEAYCDLWPDGELDRIRADARNRAAFWREELGSWGILVAEVHGDIVGYVDFEACEDDVSPETVGEVVAICVRPEWWDLGIGEALMRDAMARLRDSGWVEVVLWVVPENRRAVHFFERLGFRIDESVRNSDMYGTPATRVRLRRLLEESRFRFRSCRN